METTVLLYALLVALVVNAALTLRQPTAQRATATVTRDAHVDCGHGRACQSVRGECPYA